MNKVIATAFDAEKWEEYGLSWGRAVKSAGYSGLVVDNGLTDQARSKLADLRFRVVPQGDVSPYAALAANVNEGEKCCWSAKVDDVASFFAGEGLACACEDDLPLHNMVMPIANIMKRAEAARLIEEKVLSPYGSTLSTRLMCGDQEAWAGFVGYYGFLLHTAYLESRQEADRIALNLYAANFPGRVTKV